MASIISYHQAFFKHTIYNNTEREREPMKAKVFLYPYEIEFAAGG